MKNLIYPQIAFPEYDKVGILLKSLNNIFKVGLKLQYQLVIADIAIATINFMPPKLKWIGGLQF